MDLLNQIIDGMSKEEIRFFKIFAGRSHNSDDRKDIQLFDYIKKSGNGYDDDDIFRQLYSGKSKNSFYRLKNRLTEQLSRSLLVQHFGEDETTQTLNLISLTHHFYNKSDCQIALHFTKKAEKKAVEQENHELLDIIYSEYIKLSHELVSINPETYIEKRRKNDLNLHKLRQIDDILATVKYKLKITQNFSPGKNPVIEMLEKTVNEFSHDKELRESSSLRFKIYQAVSQILLQRHDYQNLEDYLLTTYRQFSDEKLFSRSNHLTKLQMLTYIVNTLFKNGKTEESLKYAEKLKAAMEEYNRLHYDKYLFFYYNSLVINYSKMDLDKAIAILEGLKDNEPLKKSTPFYQVFIYLNLAIFYFDNGQYRKAIKNLNELLLHDSYKNADQSLKFKIAITELIIRHELEDYEFLDYRLGQVKKEFRSLLEKPENNREKELTDILKKIAQQGLSRQDKKLVAAIKSFVKKGKEDTDDTEMINYNKWLRKKMEGIGVRNI